MSAGLLLPSLTLALASGQAPAPQPTPAAPGRPQVPAPTTSAAPAATAGDLWLVIYTVLPDRTTDFEVVARQVREALAKSPEPVRQAQARDLRIHRSNLPNAEGRHLYFLQIPALTGDSDRSGFDALIDAVLPEQATALKARLTATLDPTNPSGNTYLISLR